MSLDTLLEAAQFLEWSGEPNAKARVKPPTDFHRYAKSASKEVVKPEANGSDPSVSDGNSEDESGNKRRPGGAGTREVHNKLEKNRRAHLKDCFDSLKRQIPHLDDKKMSNLNILRCALRHIQLCKKKEKDLELEKQKMAADKSLTQQRIIALRQDLADLNVNIDISHFIASAVTEDETHSSASTATADNDEPILSDNDEADADNAPPAKRLKLMSATDGAMSVGGTTQSSSSSSPMRDEQIDVVTVTAPSGINLLKLPASHVTKVSNVKPARAGVKKAASPKGGSKVPLPVLSLNTTPTLSVAADKGAKQAPLRWTVDTTGNLNPKVSASTINASIANATATARPVRMPVTQILQQTLALRAQQQQLAQKQKLLQAQAQAAQVHLQTQAVSTQAQQSPAVITLTNNPGLRPTLTSAARPTIAQLRPTIALSPAMLPSLLSQGTSFLTAANLASLPRVNATTVSTSVSTPTVATLSKMPTSSMAMATIAMPTVSNTSVKTLTIASPAVSVSGAKGETSVTPATVNTTPALALGNIGGLKQLITTPVTQIPTAQLVTPAQLQALMSQALAQQTNNQTVSNLVSPAGTPIGALQGIQTVPLTQLMSPVTVMSPGGVQLSPGLNHPQLSNVVSAQFLKSLGITGQIPILQQPIGLPVRPIVMVTMPNVVPTTATPSTVQVNIAVTEPS